ncbi:hypothetical protein IRJ41_009468 [Triplophysa rosa]|uniref:Uncharacterized protein n=1 Tax=Triplophysa rosa TaxID=992332 RepID=A0A9W7X284_TRIRA|nr:hypothetical protein IRJ41_009468 [Triplophysa rosa]
MTAASPTCTRPDSCPGKRGEATDIKNTLHMRMAVSANHKLWDYCRRPEMFDAVCH